MHAIRQQTLGDPDVLDLVGGDGGPAALPAVRDGGLFVAVPSVREVHPLREQPAGRVRVTGFLVEPDRAGLEALGRLVDAGKLRPQVERTFPLEDAQQAHELGEQGRMQGKLVLAL